MSKDLIVVNLFGAPSSGKSKGAAYIFSKLKMMGYSAELVTEVAKDLVYEDNMVALNNQFYISGCQSLRLSRLVGKTNIVITDSPLPLGIIYNKDRHLEFSLRNAITDDFRRYNNINYVIERVEPYEKEGRLQTEEEANFIKEEIYEWLKYAEIPIEMVVDGNKGGFEILLKDLVTNHLK